MIQGTTTHSEHGRQCVELVYDIARGRLEHMVDVTSDLPVTEQVQAALAIISYHLEVDEFAPTINFKQTQQ